MSRCKCCDVALIGQVRYKSGEEFDGLFIEEDFCTSCIYQTEVLEYVDVKTYQFEDITENIFFLINYNQND